MFCSIAEQAGGDLQGAQACRVSPFFLCKDLLVSGHLLVFSGAYGHPGGWRAAVEAGLGHHAAGTVTGAPFSALALPSPLFL